MQFNEPKRIIISMIVLWFISTILDYLDRSRDDNQSLLDMEDHIKQSYPKAFEIGSKIYDVITQHTGLDLYKSERIYLVLHIQRLLS